MDDQLRSAVRIAFRILDPCGVHATVVFPTVLQVQLVVAVDVSDAAAIHQTIREWLVILQPGNLNAFRRTNRAFERSVLAGWEIRRRLGEPVRLVLVHERWKYQIELNAVWCFLVFKGRMVSLTKMYPNTLSHSCEVLLAKIPSLLLKLTHFSWYFKITIGKHFGISVVTFGPYGLLKEEVLRSVNTCVV